MSKTLKDHPSPRNSLDRDGLKKDNTRPPRNSVRNKINQIDFDIEDLEWCGDDDLPTFEKM